MTEILLSAVILLMIGANFACLYVIVGMWLGENLPTNRLARQGVVAVLFAGAVVLTYWGLHKQEFMSALPDSCAGSPLAAMCESGSRQILPLESE